MTLARREDVPDFDNDVAEPRSRLMAPVDVWADIAPVGTQSWLAGQQTEASAVTHRITIRWRPFADRYHVVLRTINLPDGSARRETYRIHRSGERQGRHRFLILDAELESAAER